MNHQEYIDYLVQSTGYDRETIEEIDRICQETRAAVGGYHPSVEDILSVMMMPDLDRPMKRELAITPIAPLTDSNHSR